MSSGADALGLFPSCGSHPGPRRTEAPGAGLPVVLTDGLTEVEQAAGRLGAGMAILHQLF